MEKEIVLNHLFQMFALQDLAVMEMEIVLKFKVQLLFQIHVLLDKPVMEMEIAFLHQHM